MTGALFRGFEDYVPESLDFADGVSGIDCSAHILVNFQSNCNTI